MTNPIGEDGEAKADWIFVSLQLQPSLSPFIAVLNHLPRRVEQALQSLVGDLLMGEGVLGEEK